MARTTARGRVSIYRRRFDGVWHAQYEVHDALGRLMFRDDGTAAVHWAGFIERARIEVGALHVLERHGYLPDKDWAQVVDEAEI